MTMLCCPGSVELVLFSVRAYLSVFYFHGKPPKSALLVTTGVSMDLPMTTEMLFACIFMYMYNT